MIVHRDDAHVRSGIRGVLRSERLPVPEDVCPSSYRTPAWALVLALLAGAAVVGLVAVLA